MTTVALNSFGYAAMLFLLSGMLGCVISGIKRHDLRDHGVPALIVEAHQELAWPSLAAIGRDAKIDQWPRVGAAVIVWSPARSGARSRAASIARWLISDVRLPAQRVTVMATDETTPSRLITSIASSAVASDPGGSLVLIFIGDAMSHPRKRTERFALGDGLFITQDEVIEAVLLGPRWLRTLAIWDACWDRSETIPDGWQAGVYPRSYAIHGPTGRQRRAKITSISAGVGGQCVRRLPGNGGPSIAYLAIAGLTGWSDHSGDRKVAGDELGRSVRWWTESVVAESEAVRAWSTGRPTRSMASAAFVAVRGNVHAFGARDPAPVPTSLLTHGHAAEARPVHQWAGGALVAPPSIPEWARLSKDEGLKKIVAVTQENAVPPTRIAELWCEVALSQRGPAARWECSRRRAYADRWRRFLPILDRDAAMLRDAIRRASRLGNRAGEQARDLVESFVATYAAYAEHPKVRKFNALLASGLGRGAVQLAMRGPMIRIPRGAFLMGCGGNLDGTCEADEKPVRKVYLSGFAIQEYEVAQRDYNFCVMTGGCDPQEWRLCYSYSSAIGFERGRNEGLNSQADDLPATCVTWVQANQYCRWIGARLPTEAEWEKAARGSDARRFPWSGEGGASEENLEIDCDRANHFECGEVLMSVQAPLDGRSPFQVAHLAGNAAEWVADFYAPYMGTFNPRGPRRGRLRSIRGGSFLQPAQDLRTSYRYALSPQYGYEFVGFRCAADE